MLQQTLATSPTELPKYMKLLHIRDSTSESDWLQECLSNDSSVKADVLDCRLEAAIECLREQTFDVIVLNAESEPRDSTQVLQALRAVSPDHQAIVVWGSNNSDAVAALWLDASADAYVCRDQSSARDLLWQLSKASERQQLRDENRKLQDLVSRNRSQQQQASFQLLREQRKVLLEGGATCDRDVMPPSWLVDYFSDLLKIHVVAGSGSLREEVSHLVERLRSCQVTLREAMLAHNVAVEELVSGQGNRGTWHILGRANVLAYELILVLTEARESRMDGSPTD